MKKSRQLFSVTNTNRGLNFLWDILKTHQHKGLQQLEINQNAEWNNCIMNQFLLSNVIRSNLVMLNLLVCYLLKIISVQGIHWLKWLKPVFIALTVNILYSQRDGMVYIHFLNKMHEYILKYFRVARKITFQEKIETK